MTLESPKKKKNIINHQVLQKKNLLLPVVQCILIQTNMCTVSVEWGERTKYPKFSSLLGNTLIIRLLEPYYLRCSYCNFLACKWSPGTTVKGGSTPTSLPKLMLVEIHTSWNKSIQILSRRKEIDTTYPSSCGNEYRHLLNGQWKSSLPDVSMQITLFV